MPPTGTGVHKDMMNGSASESDVFRNLDRLHYDTGRKDSTAARRKLTKLMGGPSPAPTPVEPPKVFPEGGEHMDGVAVSLEASLGTKIRYYTEHDSAVIDPAGLGLTLSNATGHGRMAQAASEPTFESHQPEGGKALPLGLSPYMHRYRTPLIVNQLGTTEVHAVAIKDGRQSAPVRCVIATFPQSTTMWPNPTPPPTPIPISTPTSTPTPTPRPSPHRTSL